MGDVDGAGTARAQLADDREQALGIGVGKHRGRLVEDDDARPVGECLGDLHDLLVGDCQASGVDGGVDVEAETFEDFAGCLAQPAVIDDARQAPEKDVLRDGQVGRQRQFLMDNRNTPAGGAPRAGVLHRLAVNADGPGGRLHFAGKHAHQCGFSRAVLTDQRMDFAGPQVEVDALQGLYSAKVLADAGQTDKYGHWLSRDAPETRCILSSSIRIRTAGCSICRRCQRR